MADCTEGCPAAAVMFGVAGIRVLLAERDHRGLRLTVETDQTVEGCHGCGVLAGLHDRREQLLHDTPFGHRRMLVRWRKRVWRCHEPACPVVTFTETHPLAAPRALLTRRAVIWAADALAEDDTNRRDASAPAGRRLAHPVGRPCGRGAAPGRRPDPAAGGRVARRRRARLAARAVRRRPRGDLHGRPVPQHERAGQARLLDLVLGRSGPAYSGWLTAQTPEFRASVKHAALDRSGATPRPFAITCPTRCRCWTPST